MTARFPRFGPAGLHKQPRKPPEAITVWVCAGCGRWTGASAYNDSGLHCTNSEHGRVAPAMTAYTYVLAEAGR